MIKLAIVDDKQNNIEHLKSFFADISDISLVGFGRNGKDAINIADEFHPDIILMNVKMPNMDGLEATRIISKHYDDTRVILVSAEDNIQIRCLAVKSGAMGFVVKNNELMEFYKAIHMIIKGFCFFQFGQIPHKNISQYEKNNSYSTLLNECNNKNFQSRNLVRNYKNERVNLYPESFQILNYVLSFRHKYRRESNLFNTTNLLNCDYHFITYFILSLLCCVFVFQAF